MVELWVPIFPPHAHDNGNKGGKPGKFNQGIFKSANDKKGRHPAKAAGKQPGKPDSGSLDNGLGFHIFIADACHFQHIFSSSFMKNINDIIHRHNPNDSIVIIHHGYGQVIIAGYQPGNFFPVGIRFLQRQGRWP